MIEIGKKIKSLRSDKGWTQADIAKQLNITVAAFSKIETQITDVSLSRIEQLAAIFNISVAELLGFHHHLQPGADVPDELKQARETIDRQVAKISHLQDYIITLYEELHSKAERS